MVNNISGSLAPTGFPTPNEERVMRFARLEELNPEFCNRPLRPAYSDATTPLPHSLRTLTTPDKDFPETADLEENDTDQKQETIELDSKERYLNMIRQTSSPKLSRSSSLENMSKSLFREQNFWKFGDDDDYQIWTKKKKNEENDVENDFQKDRCQKQKQIDVETDDVLTDENEKHEEHEFSEFRDTSWTIGVSYERVRKDDTIEWMLYSYQKGIDRIILSAEQLTLSLETCGILKYRKIDKQRYEIHPFHLSMPKYGLVSPKVRYNKSIELRVYALSNFVDFENDPNASRYQSILWNDAVGTIRVSDRERSDIYRKFTFYENRIFAPLRLSQIKIRGDLTISAENGFHPKWTFASVQPIIEEVPDGTLAIGHNVWPVRVLRFDDLVWHKECFDGILFKSNSEKNIEVFAGENLRGVVFSAGEKYAKNGIMTAVVVPKFEKKRTLYEALIIGPLTTVMLLTSGRLLNFSPKTWPPSVMKKPKIISKNCKL